MAGEGSIAGRTIAVTRVITGVFFLFFGEYKIAGPAFAHGGLQYWVGRFVDQDTAVGFYKVFLTKVVLTHPVFSTRVVGWGELLIGLSLVLGLLVRPASVAGAVHMISLTLATWYGPGRGAAPWKYLGNELDHLPLLLLFAIFFATRAGEIWGLDGVLRRRRRGR